VCSDQFGNTGGEKSSAELSASLAQANGFDLSYLSDNSQGVLAINQMRLLFRSLLIALLFVVFPVSLIYYQLNSQGFIKKLYSGFAISSLIADLPRGLLIISAVLILTALLGVYYLILILTDILGRSVMVVEGIGKKKITTSTDSDGDTTTSLYYVIGEQKFKVRREAYLVFEIGRTYRAYFTPRRKILVNIEALD
jgi:hypothetical protein